MKNKAPIGANLKKKKIKKNLFASIFTILFIKQAWDWSKHHFKIGYKIRTSKAILKIADGTGQYVNFVGNYSHNPNTGLVSIQLLETSLVCKSFKRESGDI